MVFNREYKNAIYFAHARIYTQMESHVRIPRTFLSVHVAMFSCSLGRAYISDTLCRIRRPVCLTFYIYNIFSVNYMYRDPTRITVHI